MFFVNGGHEPGVRGELISPWYDESGSRCTLTYRVHTSGRGSGRMRVYTQTEAGIKVKLENIQGHPKADR